MNRMRVPQPSATHGKDTVTIDNHNPLIDDDCFDGEQIVDAVPAPRISAYMDRIPYRSIHFHSSRLCESLIGVARYLIEMERINGEPPFVLALQHRYSPEDGESDLAWQVTLVVGMLETPQ
jgi:hypothetical protein